MPLPFLLAPLGATLAAGAAGGAGAAGAAGGAAAGLGSVLSGIGEAGKAIGGAMSGPLGGALTGALGLGQTIAGRQARKKSESMLPPSENPMERQMFNAIRRRRRALETGTASMADRAAMRQMSKSLGTNAFNAGGQGNLGQIAALQNQAMQNLQSQYGQQLLQTLGMEQQQSSKMADVSRDLSLLRSARESARAENLVKYGQQNLMASLGMGGGGTAPEQQNSTNAILEAFKMGQQSNQPQTNQNPGVTGSN
jgi:hypothetical protein